MFPLRDTTPSNRPPVMTVGLILINALVFAYELRLPQDATEAFFMANGVVPLRYAHWSAASLDVWPFFTCMFLHGGWLHIVTNLWILWIFGDNVEDRMGPLRFLAFYLFSGIVASAVHVATNPDSGMPIVGASGAIAGVMGAYFLLFPHARVLTVVPILFYPLFIEVPAFVFLLLWFLGQLLSGALASGSPDHVAGIAWWAHVGGFAAGALVFWIFLRGGRRRNEAWSD